MFISNIEDFVDLLLHDNRLNHIHEILQNIAHPIICKFKIQYKINEEILSKYVSLYDRFLSLGLKNVQISNDSLSNAISSLGDLISILKFINDHELILDKIGLKEHLSPTRSNGLVSMVEKMKVYAIKQLGVRG
jgi:hypothetical protein